MPRAMTLAVLAAIAALIAQPIAPQAQTAGTATAQTKAKPKKPPTPGQIAAGERAKKCGAEWKEAKATGKVEKGMKWPQYWSACNKRLKAAT